MQQTQTDHMAFERRLGRLQKTVGQCVVLSSTPFSSFRFRIEGEVQTHSLVKKVYMIQGHIHFTKGYRCIMQQQHHFSGPRVK